MRFEKGYPKGFSEQKISFSNQKDNTNSTEQLENAKKERYNFR